ncbi:TonB-dependent receptor [Chitinophaga qingshengii]|uniref:TonB-dependent receptor n=1 Tax=Chitinophaga qingshengii TaxID=1569794 RepID=A0ABR7TUX5_9BACT|nr:TonB-dependent receptor [Chitinophaga qingshengii]MBC9933418.1 TonB-dependent receptor [Chitinophaga qingshengii]
MQHAMLQAPRSYTRSRCVPVFFFYVVFLVFTGFSIAAQTPNAPPKRVSLQYVNASLKTVIRDIEKQTKYTFAISTDELETRKGVSIHVHHAALPDVVRQLFPATRYKVEIRDGQIIVIPQNTTPTDVSGNNNNKPVDNNKWQLTGIVTDGQEPLSGVSLREQGTSNGTATAENGSFKLEVASAQAVLSVSLIGFETKEIAVRDRHNIAITLQPDLKKLNELVVLGYGLQKRANITGAIAQVDGARLKSRPVPNVIAALQGTATGLVVTRSNGQPGKEGFNIQVRGVNTGGNNTPVIVDGVPGSLAVLNPDDIESVSILKDASAASIYGARGAGGVVLVTTRTGKPGKLSVDFNTLAGYETPIRIPHRLSSAQQATMENEATVNAGGFAPWQPGEIALMEKGNYYANDYTNPGFYRYYYNFNQLPLLTKKKTSVQNYNLSVKGGDSLNQFSASFGYFGRQGLLVEGPDKTHRLNARINLNNRFSKHISLETRLSYAQTNTFSPSQPVEGPQGLLAGLYRGASNVPIFVPGTQHYAFGGAASYAILHDGGIREEKNNYVDAVFTLRADSLTKGLTLRLVYSPQQHTLYDNLGRNSIQLWNATAPVSTLQERSLLQKSKLQGKGGNLQLLADYDTKVNKHNLHILGGYTQETYNTDQYTAASYDLSPDNVNAYRFSGTPQYTMTQFTTGSLMSLFGKVNYNYDNRYLLEANLIGGRLSQRSSAFPAIEQWQAFPSFSAGWRLNNEEWFYHAFHFFNEFKLRWSWGRLGNVNSWNTIDNDERLSTFTFGYNNPLSPFVYKNPVPQASGWENISTYNYGWDATLFRGRLTLSADYFVKHNRDMRIPVQLPSTAGAWPLRFNTGEMRAWGWELNAGWRSTHGPFTWYLNANLFNNQTKVLRNDGVAPQAGWNLGIPGYPYSSLFGYIADGYFQNSSEVQQHAFQSAHTAPGDIKYRDVNGDHKIDNSDLVYLGSTDPQLAYGIDAGFAWKGLEFSIFFQGVSNRKVMPDPRYNLPYTDGWQQPWDINQDYWTPNRPNALFPRLYLHDDQNTAPSSHWVMNGAYIRLKNLQLGYNLPAAWLKKIFVKNLRLYFSGQDLWESTRMKIRYYDPEQAGGYNGNVYPFFRSYTIGLNASF